MSKANELPIDSDHGRIYRHAPLHYGEMLFPAAIVVSNCAIFLFQIMLARITTPSLFGEAMALLGLMLILEAPASNLQLALSRTIQRSGPDSPSNGIDMGPLVSVVLGVGLAIFAALTCITLAARSYLHLASPPYLVAFYALPVMLGVVPKGVLAGTGRFRPLSVGLLMSGVLRLGIGTTLVHSGYGLEGAVGAVVVAETLTAIYLLFAARRRIGAQSRHLAFLWRDALGEGMAFTGFWVLAAIDVVVSRHYLPGPLAGLYAAAATLAQIVMILPGAIAAYAFSRVRGRSNTGAARVALLKGLFGVAVLSLTVAGTVSLLVRPLLRAVFDSYYSDAAGVVGVLLVSSAALAITVVVMQYLVARREMLPANLCWAGVGAFVAATAISHGSMSALAIDILVSTGAVAVLISGIALHGCRYAPDPDAPFLDLSHLDASLDLTVVVPYYNPGAALAPNISRLIQILNNSPVEFEVIAVSDGSTDGSDLTISEVQDERLRHVVLPLNEGKGAALRVGLAMGRGRYLGFIDADGDIDPQLLETFMTLVDLYQPDVVIGSKRHPLSTVHYPALRWVYSIGFQYLVRLLFHLNVRDTQTGLKLIRRDVLSATLPRMLEKRFAFDLELLVVARRLGFSRFLEAPVVLEHHFKSTISLKAVALTLVDTAAILYRLRFLRTYDRSPELQSGELRLSPAFIRGVAEMSRRERQ